MLIIIFNYVKIKLLFFIRFAINIKIPNQPTITVSGNTFSEEIVNLFKKVKKNDVIIIFDIKGVYAGKYDGLIKKPAPITFRIVKE